MTKGKRRLPKGKRKLKLNPFGDEGEGGTRAPKPAPKKAQPKPEPQAEPVRKPRNGPIPTIKPRNR